MATAEKTAKPGFAKRVGNFFSRIKKFFVNMWHELKKVTWPSKTDVVKYSIVVIVFMVVMGIVIGLIDAGAAWLSQTII